MIRTGWYTALVLATLAVVYLFWQFSQAMILFLLSLAVAAAFRPLEDALRRRGLPRKFAMPLSYALVLVTAVALSWAGSSPLMSDLQQATNDGLVTYESLRSRLMNSQAGLSSQLPGGLPSSQSIYDALTGEESGLALQAIFGAAEGTLNLLTHLVIILILSLYWSADQVHFERLWLSLLPVNQRARARSIWRAVEAGVGTTIAREVTLSVIGGLGLWLGYRALGVNYATLLAFLAVIARLIPWLGPVMIVALALSFGLSVSWPLGLLAAGYSVIVLALLKHRVGDRLFPRQRYNPLLLAATVIAMADSFGLAGAILAPILTMAVQTLLSNLLLVYSSRASANTENSLHQLQSRLDDLRQMAETQAGADAEKSANLISRLGRLIAKAQQFESAD